MSSKPEVSRREFLTRMGAAGLAVPALTAASESTALAQHAPGAPTGVAVGRSTKQVLTQSDIVYRGAFLMPNSIGVPCDTGWGFGLASRRVNGQLRFFCRAHGNPPPTQIYEVNAPAALTQNPGNAQMAQVSRVWGDIGGPDTIGDIMGLYWDEQDRRLYWTSGDLYNALRPYDPSVGYCTLDESNGTIARRGIWGLTGRSCKMAMGGLTAIPKWFSDQYCPNKRIGAGFGGYWSVATTGPVSIGPALAAFNPNDLLSTPSRSSVPQQELLGYPFNAAPYTNPQRAHRDIDYTNDFDHWDPKNGIGYWSWSDYLWQGGVWVDTPTKTGVMFFPTLSNGRTWYENSTLHAERSSHGMFVYDPADLANVAQGQKQQWEIQPKSFWLHQYAGLNYPLPGWADGPLTHVIGTTYDATSKMLYVAVRFVVSSGGGMPVVVYGFEIV